MVLILLFVLYLIVIGIFYSCVGVLMLVFIKWFWLILIFLLFCVILISGKDDCLINDFRILVIFLLDVLFSVCYRFVVFVFLYENFFK